MKAKRKKAKPKLQTTQPRYRAAEHRADLMLRGLAKALKRRRESLGLSLETIAGQIDRLTVGHIEELEARVTAFELCAYAAALDCHIELVEVNDRGK